MSLVKRFTQFVEPPLEGAASDGSTRDGVPKIETRAMDFFYGTKQALHDINLKIRSRAVTALIGP